jgi:hypothetical protein
MEGVIYMDAKIKQLSMLLGISIMHDIRMIVREELERMEATKKEGECKCQ